MTTPLYPAKRLEQLTGMTAEQMCDQAESIMEDWNVTQPDKEQVKDAVEGRR